VTAVGRHGGRPTEGLVFHSATALDPRDTRQRYGLPVTAPARTVLDLAPSLTSRGLEEVFDEALHARLMRRTEVVAMLDRYPRRPGSPRLAALAHEDRKTAWTRSDTEKRMKALLRRARLPFPEVNADFGPYQLDFFWREAGLVVETDGYKFHSTRRALETDHQKDLFLQARGLIVVRFSWRQVRDEPEMVLAQIASLLAQRHAA
jgi:very-short-patch-repair endonuclease